MDRSRLLRALVAGALMATGLVVAASPAQALNIVTVTTTTDGGLGSLRAAMDIANSDVDSTEIRLAAGATYNLTICGPDEDGNASGDLDHTDGDHLVLVGDGSTITQTCDGQRILHDMSDHDLTIRGITFTGGDATASGGAVYDANGAGPLLIEDSAFIGNVTDGDGGGVATSGSPTTTIRRTTFRGNTALGEGGGLDGTGGGVTVTIEDSVFMENTAGDQGGGSATSGGSSESHIIRTSYVRNQALGDVGGGAAASGGAATTEVLDSLFEGNEAVSDGGGLYSGGGEARTTIVGTTFDGNTSGASGGGAITGGGVAGVTVTNSTFSGNTATTSGGGLQISNVPAYTNLEYSTIAGNAAPVGANYADESTDLDPTPLDGFATVFADPQGGGTNCSLAGAPTSHGYTWVTDASCGFPEPSDVADGADPQLGAVADNGGPTPTRLPAETSPLLNVIPVADCQAAAPITDDQRDVTRPQGTGCDIGSVEAQPSDYAVPTTTTPTAAPGAALVTPAFTG